MPEAAIYRSRPYNQYGSIRRINADGSSTWVTREQFEGSIRTAGLRGGNRNQQSRITQRNFRQRGGNRTFG